MFRYSILNFFQDIHVRISAFLQDKVQHNSGRFVVAPPVDSEPAVCCVCLKVRERLRDIRFIQHIVSS